MAVKVGGKILVRRSAISPAQGGKTRRRIRIVRTSRRPVWDGIARIFDFTGALNTPTRLLPSNVSDEYALWTDWKAVGDDLRAAIGSQASDGAPNHRHRSDLKIG